MGFDHLEEGSGLLFELLKLLRVHSRVLVEVEYVFDQTLCDISQDETHDVMHVVIFEYGLQNLYRLLDVDLLLVLVIVLRHQSSLFLTVVLVALQNSLVSFNTGLDGWFFSVDVSFHLFEVSQEPGEELLV